MNDIKYTQEDLDVARREGYDEARDEGYSDGQESGWDLGYSTAKEEFIEKLDEIRVRLDNIIDDIRLLKEEV